MNDAKSRVVIGMDPHKLSVTIEPPNRSVGSTSTRSFTRSESAS